MQKWVCKILVIISLAAAPSAMAATTSTMLTAADSLYSNKQYTQALDLYKTLFKQNQYSTAMLLKMAYIQEGLGHLGESLYYLDLYFLSSDDTQALRKMEELAEKNNLEGYKTDETTNALAWLQEHYSMIAWIIASIAIFFLALTYYQLNKIKNTPTLTSIGLAAILVLLFVHINFSTKAERGIVAVAPTYLMSGPSAGASVVAIIGEGHQLPITGKEDVWFRVEWKEKEVFVKEFLVREIRL
jgi:tetratricopeptide (TPR) repeat protein